ncbi:secretory pathway protein [Niveomyces insectorum RCEF 264]|uniref:Secretory pathway protein n=1 Tax=Niveomyces insectorum RCEF 264 TaxID=1081102 RepID=A0A162MGL1_9HYPO|nr:secretory pathway protein [Niveomyces insectorum RCEF 264]
MHSTWLLSASAGALLFATALAHGDHGAAGQKPLVEEGADWLTRHMAEEHHIANFDADSVFTIHDYDEDGHWSAAEIARTYGLDDASNAHLPPTRRNEVAERVLALFDRDGDGRISRDEWRQAHQAAAGGVVVLPDLGTGPGHHGDDEYEYEIHHWEKYHDENTKLEDLTHPEDIEHFRKHEEREAEEARAAAQQAVQDRRPFVLENVPAKFRRSTAAAAAAAAAAQADENTRR